MDNRYIEKREGKNGITYRVSIHGKSKSFSERKLGKDALSFARQWRDSIRSEDYLKDNFQSVGEVFENVPVFFNLRQETVRKYNLLFNRYMSAYKNKTILKLKKSDILECLNAMVETASDDTIQRVFAMWKKISLYSVYHEIVPYDITYGIIPPKSHVLSLPKKINEIDRDLLTEMETLCHKKIKSVLEREEFPLMLWVLYYTGMRPAEMMALLKTDVNMKNRTISITKEIGSSLTEEHCVRQCKTASSVRKIPVTDELVPYLEEALKLTPSEKLFPTVTDHYYNSTVVGDRLRKISRNAGFDFNLYAIRHSFSTSLIDKTDIRTIQELMGHKNPDMSVQYARSSDEKKKEALKKR